MRWQQTSDRVGDGSVRWKTRLQLRSWPGERMPSGRGGSDVGCRFARFGRAHQRNKCNQPIRIQLKLNHTRVLVFSPSQVVSPCISCAPDADDEKVLRRPDVIASILSQVVIVLPLTRCEDACFFDRLALVMSSASKLVLVGNSFQVQLAGCARVRLITPGQHVASPKTVTLCLNLS